MDVESIFKKYGVGRRTPNDHFFDLGNRMCNMLHREGIIDVFDEREEEEEEEEEKLVMTFPCCIPTCKLVLSSLAQFEMHYNSCHRFICSYCKKQLPSPHLLDLHLLEVHDSFFKVQAERKPMYRCFIETCNQVNETPDHRRKHCIEEHKFPHDFRFDYSHKKRMKEKCDTKINNIEKMCVSDGTTEKNENNLPVSKGRFKFGQSTVKGKVFIPRQCNQNYSKTKNIKSNNKSKNNGLLKNEKLDQSGKSDESSISLNELMDTLPP